MFSPLTRKPTVRTLGAFDLEGVGGEDGFICGSFVTPTEQYYTPNREGFIKRLLCHSHRGMHFYAHLLTYDFGMLMPYLPREFEALALRGKIFKAVVHDGHRNKVYLHDSLGCMANLSLEVVGNAIGMPKLPPPPRFRGGDDPAEEWYCEDHHRLWCEECYNLRDSQIVLRAMTLLQDTMLDLGSDLQNTLAGTAMALYRRRYLNAEYEQPYLERDDFARLGYYGGRVEPYVLGRCEGINYYDFHSLYPAMMRQRAYPDPNTLRGVTSVGKEKYIREYEGVSEVTIECPMMAIPVLPVRHQGKLYFPYGCLRGVWTHAEIRYALEQGYQLREIHATLYAAKTCTPFNDYVDDLFRLRREAKARGDARELIYKIMLNSLYGKFGQGANNLLERVIPLDAMSGTRSLVGCQYMEIFGDVYARSPLLLSRKPSYINALWAAYISSYARIRLHQAMRECDFDVHYTDTDSLFTPRLCSTSDELGMLGCNGTEMTFEAIAPKMYWLDEGGGKIKRAVKGIPIKYRAEYITNKEVRFQRALGIYEAGRRKLSPSAWVSVRKIMRQYDQKRDYYHPLGAPAGRMLSRPWEINHLPTSFLPSPLQSSLLSL